MILHESPDTYLELIQAAAAQRRIPAVYVEKDYWVTRCLKHLHVSEHKEIVVFKGGTALSKAHRIIDRFSEDIDLALRLEEDLGDARRRRLLKEIEQAVTQDIQYKKGHPLESKHSRFRKTAYAFPTLTNATELGQVADTILLEINTFADPEPSSTMPIATLIHDFLNETGRVDLIRQHDLEPFDVLVLHVERTLCEKLMGLVRVGYEPDPISNFRRRIRHFYDVVMIMREVRYQEFVETDEFFRLLDQVRESDRQSMPNAETWLGPPLSEAVIFADLDKLWSKIGSEFRGNFADMVYGDTLPDTGEVLLTFSRIGDAVRRHE